MPATSRAVTVGTTPMKLVEARPPHVRNWVTVSVPQSASRPVIFAMGLPTVTILTGTALHAGDLLTIENSSAHAQPARQEVWAVVASGTQEVIVAEGP